MNEYEQKRKAERIEHINLPQQERRIYDLSATGLSVFHDTKLARDSHVDLTINELSVTARVVYANAEGSGYRVGMEFVGLNEEMRAQMQAAVEKYARGVPVRYSLNTASTGNTGKPNDSSSR